MRNRKPETTIPPEMLSTGNNSPPVLLYGWPFNDDYFLEYARHHRISFETDPKHQEWLGCPTLEFNFGDVTEAHLQRKNVVNYLRIMARWTVVNKFRRATGQRLEIGRPFSFRYSKILYMWTNYNMDEEYHDFGRPDRYDKVVELLGTAMNECLPEGQKTELKWWWSWDDNDVVCCLLPSGLMPTMLSRAVGCLAGYRLACCPNPFIIGDVSWWFVMLCCPRCPLYHLPRLSSTAIFI